MAVLTENTEFNIVLSKLTNKIVLSTKDDSKTIDYYLEDVRNRLSLLGTVGAYDILIPKHYSEENKKFILSYLQGEEN